MHSVRRAIRRVQIAWRGGVKAHRVPLRWLRQADIVPGDRLCLFALLAHGGQLLPHSIDHIAAWRAAGFKVVAIVIVTTLHDPVDLTPLAHVDGLVMRVNKGYDFGAWAATIHHLHEYLPDLSVLSLANDSVLGPSSLFGAMIDRMDRSDAVVIGLIESAQIRPHLQSFVVFFKTIAMRSDIFVHFWEGVRSGDRAYVIDHYETAMLGAFATAGLRTEALFGNAGKNMTNPTLVRWRELIEEGFPYFKVQLLRDNPFAASLDDWRLVADAGGFDGPRLDMQIAALKQAGDATWHV